MSRDGAGDYTALAERVARQEAVIRRLVDALSADKGKAPGDFWPLSHYEGLLILAALDAPAPDPAPDAGGLPASFMWGGESWRRCQCDPDDRAGGITYTDMMPPQCDDCQRHIPPVTARPTDPAPLPPALDAETNALMLDASRALDAANYTDESVTYQANKDHRASLAARLRAAAGPTP